jgi:hypothetical protein
MKKFGLANDEGYNELLPSLPAIRAQYELASSFSLITLCFDDRRAQVLPSHGINGLSRARRIRPLELLLCNSSK